MPAFEEKDSVHGGEDAAASAPSLEHVVSLLRQGRDEAVQNLIRNGELDMTWTDASGGGVLHHAVWEGRREIVRALIDSGAEINAERKNGFTPLHWAAYQGHLEIANMLLDAGAQVDALASGTTPLYWALAWKRNDVAAVLIERGADPMVSGDKHPSPLEWYKYKVNNHIDDLYGIYGPTVLAAELEDPHTFESGISSQPPSLETRLMFTKLAEDENRWLLTLELNNVEGSTVYGLIATVGINNWQFDFNKMFFGKLPPGKTAVRSLEFYSTRAVDSGQEYPFSVSFQEANSSVLPAIKGVFKGQNSELVFSHSELGTQERVNISQEHGYIRGIEDR